MISYQNFIDGSGGLVYLATSVQAVPSVRVVSFGVDPHDESTWYIYSMDPASPKTVELAQNENVAIVTAVDLKSGMRINSNHVTMRPSNKQWSDVQNIFAADSGFIRAHHPESERLYELHFSSLVLETYKPSERRIIEF
ncbi:hypothetical protein G7084_07030 [Weissella coleopterorum]|uniref:Pyridoxamine 5'-phosphate oxidase putative domain-containing protein n=1 Tax=Weissella coleopterorum TaxID=2714949 RepID=A0A6G8B1D9_9LACO|nr:hypothetical protein [Weissella coleopterorum]QIL51066.1 hypothetical protein G7084_07030 [Weissella coleopterorum]